MQYNSKSTPLEDDLLRCEVKKEIQMIQKSIESAKGDKEEKTIQKEVTLNVPFLIDPIGSRYNSLSKCLILTYLTQREHIIKFMNRKRVRPFSLRLLLT